MPAFDGERAAELAVAALEQPLDSVFESFDTTPLAAASLGQVHRATLVGGREVAVKVQREGLKDIYDKDLALLGKMVGFVDRFNVSVGGASQKWGELFDEATEILYREIDYKCEAEVRCAVV